MRENRNAPQDKGDWSAPEMPTQSNTFPFILLYDHFTKKPVGYFWNAYGYLIPFLVRIS